MTNEASPESLTVICTVDVVLLCLKDGHLHVALLRRRADPFLGQLALPGGYIHAQEDRDTADAAMRVLREKAGLESPYLEQLQTFSGPARDPRGWSMSVAYYALVPQWEPLEAAGLELVDVQDLRGLPFDHKDILEVALQRVRNKSAYSSLPAYLCGPAFTLSQLQAVYQAVMGQALNKVSFRRKLEELDMVEPIPGAMSTGAAHRPAQLYRLKPAPGTAELDAGEHKGLHLTTRSLGSGTPRH